MGTKTTRMPRDINGGYVPVLGDAIGKAPERKTINATGGAIGVNTTAFTRDVVELRPTVDCYMLWDTGETAPAPSSAAVTANGRFLAANETRHFSIAEVVDGDVVTRLQKKWIVFVAVGASAGVMHIQEME